ncbi:MAG: beta(1,3)galactosyltransferase EpsH [Clostridia bacterium]|nr:beta(1,3)galactosyltransferase EpsH [Clostridia bacterium]
MIFVMLGTQNNDFHRLLDEIEKNIENGNINEEVIVQAGFTKYESDKMRIFDVISKENLEDLIKKADLIITHAGVGSIEMSLEQNKKVIAVPRLKKFKEHVNDHQKDIEGEFNKRGWLVGINDVSELGIALKNVRDFIPKKYEKPKCDEIINVIKTFIDKI